MGERVNDIMAAPVACWEGPGVDALLAAPFSDADLRRIAGWLPAQSDWLGRRYANELELNWLEPKTR